MNQINNSNINITYFKNKQQQYLSDYSVFATKTAQSTIEMCRVVYEAKQDLSKEEFLGFCDAIGHKSENSTIRKYLAIGEKYAQFINHAELLPNSWTSIYLITQISADNFNALIATNNSMASMTGKQIQNLIDCDKDESTVPVTIEASADTPSAIDAAQSAEVVTTNLTAIAGAATVTTTSANAAANTPTSLTATSNETSAEFAASADDEMFAHRATADLIHQASKSIDASSIDTVDDIDSSYEITIRFNKRPVDQAIHAMAEALESLKYQYGLDIEIVSGSTQSA
jgi:hypothetical protein